MLELNKVLLIGNLTRDPEVRYLPSGSAVAEFDIGVNRRFKNREGELKEETLFIRIQSYGRTAEFCGEYLKKGRRVYVEGRLRSDSWEAKDGTRRTRIGVVADRIQFADLKPAAAEAEETPEPEAENQKAPEGSDTEQSSSTDDDLPF
jgi:single-strand DNA-binding protein